MSYETFDDVAEPWFPAHHDPFYGFCHEMPVKPFYPEGAIRHFSWLYLPYFEVTGYFSIGGKYITKMVKVTQEVPNVNVYNIGKYTRSNAFIFQNYFHALAWQLKLKRLKIVDYWRGSHTKT